MCRTSFEISDGDKTTVGLHQRRVRAAHKRGVNCSYPRVAYRICFGKRCSCWRCLSHFELEGVMEIADYPEINLEKLQNDQTWVAEPTALHVDNTDSECLFQIHYAKQITNNKKIIKHALRQQARRRRKNTTIAAGNGATVPRLVVKPVPAQSQPVEDVGSTTAKTQRTTMKEVLASIPGFSMKPRKRTSKKLSTAAQLEQTKEGCVDLETPDSILINTNLRALLNKYTFASLPPFYQQKLVQLLPAVDRPLPNASGDVGIRLTASGLNNEFFARACVEWQERLAEGEFTPENQQKLRSEADKERNRLDPWKLKHFEPIWGDRGHGMTSEVQNTLLRPPIRTTIKLRPTTSIGNKDKSAPSIKRIRTVGAVTRSCTNYKVELESTVQVETAVKSPIPDLLPIKTHKAHAQKRAKDARSSSDNQAGAQLLLTDDNKDAECDSMRPVFNTIPVIEVSECDSKKRERSVSTEQDESNILPKRQLLINTETSCDTNESGTNTLQETDISEATATDSAATTTASVAVCERVVPQDEVSNDERSPSPENESLPPPTTEHCSNFVPDDLPNSPEEEEPKCNPDEVDNAVAAIADSENGTIPEPEVEAAASNNCENDFLIEDELSAESVPPVVPAETELLAESELPAECELSRVPEISDVKEEESPSSTHSDQQHELIGAPFEVLPNSLILQQESMVLGTSGCMDNCEIGACSLEESAEKLVASVEASDLVRTLAHADEDVNDDRFIDAENYVLESGQIEISSSLKDEKANQEDIFGSQGELDF